MVISMEAPKNICMFKESNLLLLESTPTVKKLQLHTYLSFAVCHDANWQDLILCKNMMQKLPRIDELTLLNLLRSLGIVTGEEQS